MAIVFLAGLVFASHLAPPVRRALGGVLRPFLHLVSGGNGAQQAATDHLPIGETKRARLRELEAEVAQLTVQLARHDALLADYRQLRAASGLAPLLRWERVVAPVIARDPASWRRELRIGKGSRHGIKPGALVLRGANVLGRVRAVTETSAEVVTVADPSCRLSVRLSTSGAVGVLAGQIGGGWREGPVCIIDFLQRDADIRLGESVLTSNLSSEAPGGLRVGKVTTWKDDQVVETVQTAYARVNVRPAASLSDLSFVTVLVPQQIGGE